MSEALPSNEGQRFTILAAEGLQARELVPLHREAWKVQGAVFCEARENGALCFGVLSKAATQKIRKIIAADAPFPPPEKGIHNVETLPAKPIDPRLVP